MGASTHIPAGAYRVLLVVSDRYRPVTRTPETANAPARKGGGKPREHGMIVAMLLMAPLMLGLQVLLALPWLLLMAANLENGIGAVAALAADVWLIYWLSDILFD